MGNVVGSVSTGFVDLIGKLFGHPLDFLAGKSCNTVCGPTWDLTCYIENFCLAHLGKLMLVSVLFYFVLVFFYLLKKLGIFHCIFHIIDRLVKSCFSTCFYGLECCCTSICSILDKHNQRRRKKKEMDVELAVSGDEDCEESSSYRGRHRRRDGHGRISSYRGRHRRDGHGRSGLKQDYLGQSLKPRSHGTWVEISRNSEHLKKGHGNIDSEHTKQTSSPSHLVRVTRTSNFANKKHQLKHSRQRRRQSSHL
ncbi:hypothetical protein LIER_08038 [Lithospermum erythrorhizon]|uniref:Uncharacterized protein n=1 Tax=Lithospermum erythrorhizon TaxID=34254 RepID=A0AAV3PED6_LITER